MDPTPHTKKRQAAEQLLPPTLSLLKAKGVSDAEIILAVTDWLEWFAAARQAVQQ